MNRAALRKYIESLPDEIPFLWVEHTCGDGTGHTHTAMDILEADAEEIGTLLAESIANCNEGGHIGLSGKPHGKRHASGEAEAAFASACEQVHLQRAGLGAAQDWRDSKHRLKMYYKWGGHMPAAVVLPSLDDPNVWNAVIPDANGNPYVYPVRKQVMDNMPDPRDLGAKPNPYLGWTLPKKKKVTA